jgi:hypothetical protein
MLFTARYLETIQSDLDDLVLGLGQTASTALPRLTARVALAS